MCTYRIHVRRTSPNHRHWRSWYGDRTVLDKLYLSRIPLHKRCQENTDGHMVSVVRHIHTDESLEADGDALIGKSNAINNNQ